MSAQFQPSRLQISWRGGQSERLWLAALVDAMEDVAHRTEPCNSQALKALRAQLALPAQRRFASPFSLRN